LAEPSPTSLQSSSTSEIEFTDSGGGLIVVDDRADSVDLRHRGVDGVR
jgi:hypothetical protein